MQFCMSRQQQRQQQQQLQQQQQQQQQLLTAQQQQQQALLMAEHAAAAKAAEYFDLLCVATTMRQILGLHRDMCEAVGLRPAPFNEFYPKLKAKVRSWKAQALWKKFDARAAHRVYGKGNACSGTRVLVIGAGPCGLRTAIEAQLLGAKVVVLEKRDRITRNNVLHLWPFVITDLRNLGAKKFYGKFCAGAIDHISIRQLQCMLLKVALLLGVEIHEGVSFDHAVEPNGDGGGWRAAVTPAEHAVSHYEFDCLVGADGKRNMLDFRRKEFRGKLAIAITANFINKKTEAEAKVEEISGVAFIFNQAFFKELYSRTGIDLENIVYYKDETHYFVMTAKKHSLIDKGVIIEDMADPAELLAGANVDTQKLHDYAREAAEFSTQYQMPNLEFAVNHYGKPDVAMFDFTSMFAAEMSCRVRVRKGYRLLQCLVGDSLLEPFWPTGSGCARGFLSSMDAAYAIKLWSNPQNSTLGVLAQRESIYRLLNQTTPDTLQRDISAYTVDPATRYPNLNRDSVNSWQVKHLIDTDDPAILEQTFMDTHALQAPHLDTPGRRKRASAGNQPQAASLLRWISAQLAAFPFTLELKEPTDIFRQGRVLCALISRYRPDLIDFAATADMSPLECNELAFAVLERELHIERIMSARQSLDMHEIESRVWLNYLDQICELFRGEVPYIKHAKMDFSDLRQKYRSNRMHAPPDFSKLLQAKPKAKSPMQDAVDVPTTVQRRSVLEEERAKRQRRHEHLLNAGGSGGAATPGSSSGAVGTGSNNLQQAQGDTPRRSKKRRQADKTSNIEERQQRLQEIEDNRQERMSRRRQQRFHQTQNFYKSLQLLQAGKLLRESGDGVSEGVAEDGTPFEDYSIFLYRQQAPIFNDRVKELERKLLFPDRERGDIPSAGPRAADEQFSDRIKNMEQRMQGRAGYGSDKKPKDLMRAIGKIDSNDWNVREIEKKIELSKKTEIHGPKGREKVPKWSKEQFQARQHKMSKPQRQDSREAEKFKEIDQTIKNLDKQLKEGHNLDVGERGRNKVASIAGQFVKKDDGGSDEKNASSNATSNTNTNNTVIPKSSSKVALAFKKQAAHEKCSFCKQTVYLMEKTTVEGLVLHRNCLKCHHCHTSLRLGGYAFDRDDPQGRFYCTQHFRLPAKPLPQRVNKARRSGSTQAAAQNAAAAAAATSAAQTAPHRDTVDLLDTSRAAAAASADAMSDDEANVIDELEWSGRNFLPESNNDSQSELSSSDESDTESDTEMFEEADDSPFGAQTLQLASDWIGKQYCEHSDDSDDFYDSSEGIADDGKDDTEGEEFKKARELRREEVRLQPLPTSLPTDTETEVQTESESTSPDEVELNSATEISTDSEFDNDEIIRQAPKIFVDDTHLRKPTKVQIKSSIIPPSAAGLHQKLLAKREKGGSYLQKYQPQPALPQFKPLVQVDPTLLISSQRAPLQNPRPGDYLLNKTASTEGIASKKSLELKKRYLLGETANGNKIQKSGSTSVLDSKIRSFQSNISECQKLLNPSSDISASMRSFLDRTKLSDAGQNNELMRSATSNVINDLRVELKIQKTNSSNSTDNEKENVFVNSKNELNKGMEYTDAVNATLLEQLNSKKSSPTTPTNNNNTVIVDVIDLITPEKPVAYIDLTVVETPKKLTEDSTTSDSNKLLEAKVGKPDVSKDVKQCIPDILGDIKAGKAQPGSAEEQQALLGGDEEKRDEPEKCVDAEAEQETETLQIQVPNIPWSKPKSELISTTASSANSCSSSESSSIEDIQHYILESTTSPDTQTTHNVPRLEVHDSSGALMQVDSLMIVNGKYIGDPEDVKYLDMPAGVIVPALKTSELEDDTEPEADVEPVTATPEPADCTVIETPQPQPERGPPKLKFDSKNENKIESLKHLPLIVERSVSQSPAVKPVTLNLSKSAAKTPDTPTTPTQHDSDKTPTAELQSRCSDSETEHTGTGQVLTETELSDWTADDCISENFVDMEFVLNSNKGTMKRRKQRKERRSQSAATVKLPSSSEVLQQLAQQAPVAKMEGILQAIDIDDIEFMDTGSEGSCAEAYSATNTALLHNRGYMEYIETAAPQATAAKSASSAVAPSSLPPLLTKRDEKLGVDYIEQGAYIMHDDAKTPVNEAPPRSIMQQSLTDSSTLQELDEDSLAQAAALNTTTEESEPLTVVTSPLDTSSPAVLDQFASLLAANKPTEPSTPSSSDQQPQTTQSNVSTVSGSSSTQAAAAKEAEDIQMEYVRALQQRISDISTQRRKSSKGEAPLDLEQAASAGSMRPRSSSSATKVPEIPTLNSKLEEISKERTKQKDLIHDLVMDKLQSKKQLNAEKRLHRSRQRSLLTSGYASGASLSPTPKLAAASSSADSCSNHAHYHVSTAAPVTPPAKPAPAESVPVTHVLQKSATSSYVSPYRAAQPAVARSTDLYKSRPFSELLDGEKLKALDNSLCYAKQPEFSAPLAPVRPQRSQRANETPEASISASTENLRSEARARARLKSNSELGLSPEEKMQLLRKRHYEQHKVKPLEQPLATDLAARARKMSASKSVNDLAYMTAQLQLESVSRVKPDFTSDTQLEQQDVQLKSKSSRRQKDPERRKSLIQSLSSFFHKTGANTGNSNPKEQLVATAAGSHSAEQAERPGTSSSGTPTISDTSSSAGGGGGVFSRFRISPKSKEKSKDKDMLTSTIPTTATTQTKHSQDYLNNHTNNSRCRKQTNTANHRNETFSSSSPQLYIHKPHQLATATALDDQTPPPIPPLPLNYQRSDDESNINETREHKKQRAISKASRQAELKRLRIAQEIQREQEEIEVQLKELEARGVLIEKALRGEAHNCENMDTTKDNDEKQLKELLEIWRNITALKKRDEELTIRQHELQLEYRHAQLKEELNLRLSCSKLDKSSADVAAEGAILNEMLEIVAKRAALRPTASNLDLTGADVATTTTEAGITLAGQPHAHDESNI